jgi:hypothetical protein
MLNGILREEHSMKYIRPVWRFKLLVVLALILVFGIVGMRRSTVAAVNVPTGTIHVALTGSDTDGCGSEASPCQSIQYAVNKSADIGTIKVSAGTYRYNLAADNCRFLITPSVICFVNKDLSILGGYTTSNWATPNPVNNITIIDGQNTWRGVAVISYDNGTGKITASLRMEGFTIQHGRSQGAASADDFQARGIGGGIWLQHASATLRDMKFLNNQAVGSSRIGISSYGGQGVGGAVAVEGPNNGVVSRMERVVFDGNQALGGTGTDRGGVAIGGALFTYEAEANGSSLTFTNNIAQAGNSSGNGVGGGLRADALGGGAGFQINSTTTLDTVYAIGNQSLGGEAGSAANSNAGGGYGGAFSFEETTASINNVKILDNEAIGGDGWRGGYGLGGGILADKSNVTIDRALVINNHASSGNSSGSPDTASSAGGGFYMTAFNPIFTSNHIEVTNCIVAQNEVGLGNPGTSVEGGGGVGMVVQGINATIIHVTVVDNRFGSGVKVGQAIVVQGLYGNSGTAGTANIQYSIISDHINNVTPNTSALTVFSGSTANLNTVMFYGNTNNTNANGKPVPPGTINQVNSLFPNIPIGYVSPGSPYFNYHLQSSSPAIDQAINSTTSDDIDGQHRPYGAARDIGADEYINFVDSIYLPLTLR